MTATIVGEEFRHLAEPDQDIDSVSPWPPSQDEDANQPVLPLRRHVIGLIAKEAKCTRWRAGCTMRLLARKARKAGRLTSGEMLVAHAVLDKIIPDGSSAYPRSAHEALDQRYLSTGVTFTHGKTDRGSCHVGPRVVDTIRLASRS